MPREGSERGRSHWHSQQVEQEEAATRRGLSQREERVLKLKPSRSQRSQLALLNWCPGLDELQLLELSGHSGHSGVSEAQPSDAQPSDAQPSRSTSLLRAVCLSFGGVCSSEMVGLLRGSLAGLLTGELYQSLLLKMRGRWSAEGLQVKVMTAVAELVELTAPESASPLSSCSRFNYRVLLYALANVCKRGIVLLSDARMPGDSTTCGGLYLPLDLPPSECNPLPLVLSYADGQFAAVGSSHGKKESLLPVIWESSTGFRVHFASGMDPAQAMSQYLRLMPHENKDGVTPCCLCSLPAVQRSESRRSPSCQSPVTSEFQLDSSCEDTDATKCSDSKADGQKGKLKMFPRLWNSILSLKSEIAEFDSPRLWSMVGEDNNVLHHAHRSTQPQGHILRTHSSPETPSSRDSFVRNCSEPLHSARDHSVFELAEHQCDIPASPKFQRATCRRAPSPPRRLSGIGLALGLGPVLGAIDLGKQLEESSPGGIPRSFSLMNLEDEVSDSGDEEQHSSLTAKGPRRRSWHDTRGDRKRHVSWGQTSTRIVQRYDYDFGVTGRGAGSNSHLPSPSTPPSPLPVTHCKSSGVREVQLDQIIPSLKSLSVHFVPE